MTQTSSSRVSLFMHLKSTTTNKYLIVIYNCLTQLREFVLIYIIDLILGLIIGRLKTMLQNSKVDLCKNWDNININMLKLQKSSVKNSF